ncbi:MAG: DNA repair protein RadC [Granulosicoccus sp.]
MSQLTQQVRKQALSTRTTIIKDETMAITDWPMAERPRERLLLNGASALSDAELLAIFLRTGCAGLSAVDLARRLLNDFGGLRAILDADQSAFCKGKGLGNASYAQLQAVLEMAKRHLAETLTKGNIFTQSEQVKRYLSAQLRHRQQEIFATLFLNSQHQLLRYQEIFFGTVNSASVYPREIVKLALEHNAVAVIFAHNHPSGIAEPSQADRHITQQLIESLRLIDIKVLDHLVVGDGEVCSFAERGWL